MKGNNLWLCIVHLIRTGISAYKVIIACRSRFREVEFRAKGFCLAFSRSKNHDQTYLETLANTDLRYQLLHLAALLKRRWEKQHQ
jgi:hypothetical protein